MIFPFFILSASLYFYDVFAGGLLLAIEDGLHYFYPMLSMVSEQYREGVLPLWNSRVFSGFPLMATMQPGVFYPFVVLHIFLPPALAYNLDVLIHIALAGFFVFLYTRKTGADVLASLVAGFSFAFLGYLTPHIMHLSILRTAVWLPLILYFLESLRQEGKLKYALAASLAIALQVFAGHPQICLYSYLVVFIYIANHLFGLPADRKISFLSYSALSIILGLSISSPQLYATYELYSLGIRPEMDYGTFTDYAFSLKEISSFFFPIIYGREGYVGYLALITAIITAVSGRKNPHVRFMALVAVVSLALAIGLLDRALFYMPLYNKFRGSSKHLFEYGLAVSVLYAYGISSITKSGLRRLPAVISFLISVIFIYALWFASIGKISDPSVYITLISTFICLTALLMIFVIRRPGAFVYIAMALLVFDAAVLKEKNWPDAKGASEYGKGIFDRFNGKTGRSAFFIRDIGVLMAASRGASTADGYDPLLISDYSRLLDMGYLGSISYNKKRLIANNSILSMLNVKYIFALPEDAAEIEKLPFYRKTLETPVVLAYENTLSLSRAYSVSNIQSARDIEEVKVKLYTHMSNPADTALVLPEDLKEIGTSEFVKGKVEITAYKGQKVFLKTDFDGRGFVVLSEQFYPGWKASIDGKPIKIYKTNGVLKGIVVPEGNHEVVFSYRPTAIYVLIASGLTLFLGISAMLVFLAIRKTGRYGKLNMG